MPVINNRWDNTLSSRHNFAGNNMGSSRSYSHISLDLNFFFPCDGRALHPNGLGWKNREHGREHESRGDWLLYFLV